MTLFTREELIVALRELVQELHAEGATVGIRLVGGSALSLRYFDRPATQDLDALHVGPGSDELVTRVAERIARRRGWDPNWLNFEVTKTGAEPLYGRAVEWETIYLDDDIVIQVASAEALLAMKLRANRPGRDTDDIRQLLAICAIGSLDVAEALYEEYYPGEALDDRAVQMARAIFEHGSLTPPPRPHPLDLSEILGTPDPPPNET